MPSLIETLRLMDRENRNRHILDPNAAPQARRIHDDFEQLTGRFDSVPRRLDSNKRREADLFLDFLLATHVPADCIALGEIPDFMISVGERKIGIEMMRTFLPQPVDSGGGHFLKGQEERQDAIAERAMRLHKESGGQLLRLHLLFGDTNFRKADVQSAAETLAGLVPPAMADGASLTPHNAAGVWPSWLKEIRTWRTVPECLREADPHRWKSEPLPGIGMGGFQPWEVERTGSVRAIEDCARHHPQWLFGDKEKKLPEYRKRGWDEYWLLRVIEGSGPSSYLRIMDPEQEYPSAFDVVFLFWPHKSKVCKLRTRRKETAQIDVS